MHPSRRVHQNASGDRGARRILAQDASGRGDSQHAFTMPRSECLRFDEVLVEQRHHIGIGNFSVSRPSIQNGFGNLPCPVSKKVENGNHATADLHLDGRLF